MNPMSQRALTWKAWSVNYFFFKKNKIRITVDPMKTSVVSSTHLYVQWCQCWAGFNHTWQDLIFNNKSACLGLEPQKGVAWENFNIKHYCGNLDKSDQNFRCQNSAFIELPQAGLLSTWAYKGTLWQSRALDKQTFVFILRDSIRFVKYTEDG